VPHRSDVLEDYLHLILEKGILVAYDPHAEIFPPLQLLFLALQSLRVLCPEEYSLDLCEVDSTVLGLLLLGDPLYDLFVVGKKHKHAFIKLSPPGDSLNGGPVDDRVKGCLLVYQVKERGRLRWRPGRC
jgi:hypothetical protein